MRVALSFYQTRGKHKFNELINSSHDLFHLWIKVNQFNEMARLLDAMYTIISIQTIPRETFTKVPEQIQELIKDKFYLTAAQTIMINFNSIREQEFKEIAALSDIREKLETVKGVIFTNLYSSYVDASIKAY